jgi:hypothetical protein
MFKLRLGIRSYGGEHMRDATKDPKLIQGTETLAVLTAEGRVVKTFKIDGLQKVSFNLNGYWYEIRRNTYPTEDAFSLYQIIFISGTV